MPTVYPSSQFNYIQFTRRVLRHTRTLRLFAKGYGRRRKSQAKED